MRKERLKKLVSFYKPYKTVFFLDLLCSLVKAGIALVLPLGVGYITGALLERGGPGVLGQVLWVGAGLLALVLIQALCSYYSDYQGHYLGAKIERDMREEMFRHCQGLSFSYYDSHTVGDLMSRITNDSLALAEFFHHVPEDLVVNVIKFIGAAAILLWLNWPIALVILAFLPFMTWYTLHFNKKMAAALALGRERMGAVNAQTEDSLSGIRVVQSFGNEPVEEAKFAEQNQRFCEARRLGYRGEALCWGGMEAFASLIPIAVAIAGSIAILKGSMPLSELVVFLMYVSSFTGPIQSLVNTSRLIQEGRTAFARYTELMETKPEIADAPGAPELPRAEGKLEFRDVGFRYQDGETVFRHLDLTVEAGEYVALVGASGVGKTTLCSLIPRFYQPEEGQVLLDGVPVQSVTLSSLRKNIGLVQQDVYLFTGTVAENIAYGRPGASREEVVEAAKKAGAHDFIEKLPQGYDTDIGPHGVRLSGGQQQRLSIARVFLKDPPVLLFDEATSALDAHSEKVVQRSLEQLARHRTTLVIAHRLSTIQNAGRILVLDEHGICEEGTHREGGPTGGSPGGLPPPPVPVPPGPPGPGWGRLAPPRGPGGASQPDRAKKER